MSYVVFIPSHVDGNQECGTGRLEIQRPRYAEIRAGFGAVERRTNLLAGEFASIKTPAAAT